MKNLAAIVLMLTSFSTSIVLGSQGSPPLKQTDQETVTELAADFPKLKKAVVEVATSEKHREYRDLDNYGLGYPSSFFAQFAEYFNGKEKNEGVIKTLKGLQAYLDLRVINGYAKPLNIGYEKRLKALKRIDTHGIERGVARMDPSFFQEIQVLDELTSTGQNKIEHRLNNEELKSEYDCVLNLFGQHFNLDGIQELSIGITHFDPKKNNLYWHIKAICNPKFFPSVRKLSFHITYHREKFWGMYEDAEKVKENILAQFSCLKDNMPTLKEICFEAYLDIDD